MYSENSLKFTGIHEDHIIFLNVFIVRNTDSKETPENSVKLRQSSHHYRTMSLAWLIDSMVPKNTLIY